MTKRKKLISALVIITYLVGGCTQYREIAVSDSVKERLLKSRVSPWKVEKIYNAIESKVNNLNSELQTPNSALELLGD